jgi:hypothetical protein
MPKQHENDPHMNDIAVHRQLASLQTSVEHVTETMKQMAAQWASQEQTAVAGRRALHEKFEHFRDDVGLQISGVSMRIDRLTDQVKAIEPMVTAFKEKMEGDREDELLSEGARRFRVKVVAWVGTAAGAVGWGIHELVNYIKH